MTKLESRSARVKKKTFNIVLNAFALSLLYLFYLQNKYYSNFLYIESKRVLFILFIVFQITNIIVCIKNKNEISYTQKIFEITKKIFSNFNNNFKKPLNDSDKNIILFLIVKIFFFPLLLNFFIGNVYFSKNKFIEWGKNDFQLNIEYFNSTLFHLILSVFFAVDTGYFLFSYLFVNKKLKNIVKSVDKTALGWVSALICYPPFSNNIDYFVTWYPDTYENYKNQILALLLNLVIIFTWFIYVWATVALGSKSANLCNRGIITRGPYKYLRHPAYVAKNIGWWLATIPMMSVTGFKGTFYLILNGIFVTFIYYLRSVTEERHLSHDQEYLEYKEKVRNRFIPSFASK